MAGPRPRGDAPAYYSSEWWFEDWKLIGGESKIGDSECAEPPIEFAGVTLRCLVVDHELQLANIDAVRAQLNGLQ